MRLKLIVLSLLTLFIMGCSGGSFVPKPRGLNHIELPPVGYQEFNMDSIPYSFSYSKNAKIASKNGSRNEQIIEYTELGAKVWLTHFPIKNNEDTLDALMYTTYKLLQKNNVKAESIDADSIKTKSGNTAMIFNLSGEVPTQFQFFMHDNTTNFLRGALYFETAKKNDSLAPIIEYVKKDVEELINTLEWRD